MNHQKPVAGRLRASQPHLRLLNRPVQYLLDIGVLAASFTVAYAIRFEFVIPPELRIAGLRQLPLAVLLQFAALSVLGVYSFIWRYIGMSELRSFIKASLLATIPLLAMRLTLPDSLRDFRIPISVLLIDAVLGFGGVIGLRVFRRFLYERYERKGHSEEGAVEPNRALLIGAGRAGVLAAREILGRADVGLEILGFLDDDPEKVGSSIHGIRVLGTTGNLARFVAELRIEEVVITIAQAPRKAIRRIVELCKAVPVKVRIMPGVWEVLQGKVQVSSIRNVEIEDLLGREPVSLEEGKLRAFLAGRTVMVTGAGGSIGSELVRQVARLGPQQLLLVERAEFALFEIEREIRRAWPNARPVPLVADIGEEPRMRAIFAEYRPQVVIHAAAHKHVPLMETNPTEAIRNNILATHLFGEVAGEYGAEVFVLISTDKAVRPASIMGASKRIAELIVQDLDTRYATRFLAVRFGNVLGSAGSVIPIFRKQIRDGGPITITHPDMVRYFMTIPEASQLVLQASAMGQGGEVFILDMGEPVRIVDLARDMIVLSGLKPGEDIDIVFTGIRPGEKLSEEMGTEAENIVRTRHPKIFIGKIAAYPAEQVERALERLRLLADHGDQSSVRRFLQEILPDAQVSAALAPDSGRVPARGLPGKTSVA